MKDIQCYTTSLGDYLSLMASKNDMTKQELEKIVEIEEEVETSASLLFLPQIYASKKFYETINKKGYDAIVDLRTNHSAGFLGLVSTYEILGTGVKLNLDKHEK